MRFNSSPLGKNDRHFPDDIYKCIFMNEKFWILIRICSCPINNILVLAQIIVLRRSGANHYLNLCWPSSLTHICSTRIWVNYYKVVLQPYPPSSPGYLTNQPPNTNLKITLPHLKFQTNLPGVNELIEAYQNVFLLPCLGANLLKSLQRRHNERDGVSNHRLLHCLLNY